MMLDTVVHVVTAKVIEELHKVVRNEVRVALEESVSMLLDRLDQIEDRIEQQSLGPLRAGLTFAKLQLWREARDEFVRAHGIDQMSPVAAVWLGHALLQTGNELEAHRFVELAVKLNPFQFAKYLPSPALTTQQGDTPVVWTHKLPSRVARGVAIPTRWRDRLRERVFPPTSSAAVATVSGASGSPIVEWRNSITYRSEFPRTITAFAAENAEVQWTLSSSDYQLVLSTPSFVVLARVPDGKRLRLIACATGRAAMEVSRNYFNISFQDVDEAVALASNYLWRSVSVQEAWDRSAGRRHERLESLAVGIGHEGGRFHEFGTIPLLGRFGDVVLRNAYAHEHRSYTSIMMGMRTTCDFFAHAYITRRETSVLAGTAG